jgi:hypothetical protein
MITVYTYKGKFGDADLPADYIPCLVGYKAGLLPGDLDDEAYFETLGEIEPSDVTDTRRSKWFCSATAIIALRFTIDGRSLLGYALADELLTAGVNF